jgi:hypothetical protein
MISSMTWADQIRLVSGPALKIFWTPYRDWLGSCRSLGAAVNGGPARPTLECSFWQVSHVSSGLRLSLLSQFAVWEIPHRESERLTTLSSC